MFCMEYRTVNNDSAVLIPISNISHIIEGKPDATNDPYSKTCWIQFESGKSIHVTTSYEEVAKDMDSYYKTLV